MSSGVKGAFSGAVFGGIGGYYGDAWNIGRVSANGLAGGVTSKANGGEFRDGARLALATSIVRLGWEKMRGITNAHKINASNQPSGRGLVYNSRGEPMTYSNRGSEQMIEGYVPGTNFITRLTDGAEWEGSVFSNKDGLLARTGNIVSKGHDWWNSDFSKMVGFEGYSLTTGFVLQGTEAYNTAFQLWSLAGMLPMAGYSGVAMSASAPYLYEVDEY